MKFDKTHAALFDRVVFLVEANSNEYFSLWQNFAHESPHRLYPNVSIKWEQDNPGKAIEIGKVVKRPTCVSITYAILNGHRVAFYCGCSQLVDHKMIETWIEHFTNDLKYDGGTRHAECDAANFHACFDTIGVQK